MLNVERNGFCRLRTMTQQITNFIHFLIHHTDDERCVFCDEEVTMEKIQIFVVVAFGSPLF